MRVLLTGLPGSGKTTQSKLIVERYDLCLLTSGDIFRRMSKENNPLGEKIRQILKTGDMVDDKLTSEVVKAEMKGLDCLNGFIIDGYPRSVKQLEYFDPKFDVVIYLKISPEIAVERLDNRGRVDDTPEVIRRRMEVQAQKFDDLHDFLAEHSKFVEVDALKPIDEVFEEIRKVLDEVSNKN